MLPFYNSFFQRTICWLCENFFHEKVIMIICKDADEIETLDNEQMDKICSYHKLLIKLNDVMKNDFLTKQQKCDGVLDLFEMDKRTFGELVDFFYFCTKDIRS